MARSPKYDPQREEVYRWEKKCAGIWYTHKMTNADAKLFIKAMCERYGVPPPRFKSVEDAPWAAAAHGDVLIEFNRSKIKPTGLMVAHESAHIIHHACGYDDAPHGPRWLGIYIDLLDYFQLIPRCMTEPSARKAGLKFKRMEP